MSKFFSLLATVGLLFIAFLTSPVSAASDNLDVSDDLIKDVMKSEIVKQNLQDQAIKNTQANKLREVQAEQARMDDEAKKEAEAIKAKQEAEQKQKAASTQAPSSQAPQKTENTVNKGTFKLSFYDPAAMGSNMGYSGVAANLSIFPKGTKLKITLSDGTVWYRVVNDTGGFAASNPRQLDVAMPNSQVPSAGILYAAVEVVA